MNNGFTMTWETRPGSQDVQHFHSRPGMALTSEHSQYLFARDESGVLTGGCRVSFNFDFMVLENIWVEESLHGSGLGIALFQETVKLARKRNCQCILLSTFRSMDALGFWERVGFKIVGQVEDCPKNDVLYYLQLKFT